MNDLHELTSLWFEFFLCSTRKKVNNGLDNFRKGISYATGEILTRVYGSKIIN